MEEPKKNLPDKGETSKDTDGIVDELRNMLSSLGEEEAKPDAIKKSKEEEESLGSSAPPEEEKIGDAGIPPAFSWPEEPPPAPETLQPEKPEAQPDAPPGDSDKDFWSGNVLGWPANPEQPKPEAPTPAPAPAEPTAPKAEEPVIKEPEESLFEPSSHIVPKQDPPPPTPPPSTPQPPENKKALEEGPDVRSLDAIFPKGPAATPPQKPKEAEDASKLFDDAGPFGEIFNETEAKKEESDKPESKSSLEPPAISLPGTIETKKEQKELEIEQNADVQKSASVDFEADEKVPDGVLQISCLFPEGAEAEGQTFISNLKSMATRQKGPIELNTVFVQAWNPSENKLDDMEKTAELSGSQYMFVLVSKKDQALYANRARDSRKGIWKGRIVYVEQVKMKTLYADLLLQLGRLNK